MSWRFVCALVALWLFGQPVQAESKFYYGLGVNSAEYEVGNATVLDTNGLGLKFGREFSKFLSIEVHYGVSADANDNLIGDPEISYGGAFGRINLPLESVNIYAIGGVSKFDITLNTQSASSEGTAVGFGIDLIASETTALTLESLKYSDDDVDAIELSVITLGFTHRFDLPGLR